MEERNIGNPKLLNKLKELLNNQEVKLNNFINSTYKSRNKGNIRLTDAK